MRNATVGMLALPKMVLLIFSSTFDFSTFSYLLQVPHLPELLVRHGLPRLIARIQQHAQQVRARRCARRQRRPPLLCPVISLLTSLKHAHRRTNSNCWWRVVKHASC